MVARNETGVISSAPPNLAKGCSQSRRGRFSNSKRPVMHKTQVRAAGRRTAAHHGGTRVARAQSVDERIVTMPVSANGRERDYACLSRFGRSSSRQS